jgi:hypothetical protein
VASGPLRPYGEFVYLACNPEDSALEGFLLLEDQPEEACVEALPVPSPVSASRACGCVAICLQMI